MYFCSLREFVKWLMETKQELLTLMSFLLGVGLGEGPGHFSEPQALQSLPYILGWETLSSAHKRGRVPLAWCGFSFHPFQVLKEAPGRLWWGRGGDLLTPPQQQQQSSRLMAVLSFLSSRGDGIDPCSGRLG